MEDVLEDPFFVAATLWVDKDGEIPYRSTRTTHKSNGYSTQMRVYLCFDKIASKRKNKK